MFRRIIFNNFRWVFTLDRWIKRRFSTAGILVLGSLIAAGVFGIDTRQTLAYQLFSLLLALLLFAIFSSWFIRIRLTLQRKLPRFATVGEPLSYQVFVYNHSREIQHDLILRENIQWQSPDFETFLRAKEPGWERRNWFDNYIGYPRWLWLMNLGKGVNALEKKLPPLAPAVDSNQKPLTGMEVKMTLLPWRRGYVRFTGMTVSCLDPLGLSKALHIVPLVDSLLVLPKRYPIRQITLAGTKKYQRGGVQLAMSVGETEEFVSLREYRPGDPWRRIHWKSLAKLGKPVVKEFQEEFFVRHALILDTFTTEVISETFEAAVSVAASFASAPRSQEILLDLMLVGTESYCFTGGRGLGQTDKLLEILACVQTCSHQPFHRLNALVQEHLPSLSGSLCVLLNWNAERQQLLQLFKNHAIPCLAVIISQQELVIDKNQFPEVHVCHPQKLAEQLVELSL
jgi:uncharacterized protein (DUF58 family)